MACLAMRWLLPTRDTVGGWFCRLSGNTPGPGTERDPAGVRQDSPGRKPWVPWQVRMSALTGRCRQLRPFQAGILGAHVARARALAFAARPFQGRSVGGSPSEKMRAFSQGLRPGLSCTTLSGSSVSSIGVSPFGVIWIQYRRLALQGHLGPVSASHPGRPAKHVTIGTDRGWLLTTVPLRLIRVSQGPGRRCTPTVSRVGNNQRSAGRPKPRPPASAVYSCLDTGELRIAPLASAGSEIG